MIIIATVVITLAAAVHVAFFVMESIAWPRPGVWKRFGVADQAAAETTRPLAYNQGFYNLFLAIGAILGEILFGSGAHAAGLALMLLSLGSMVAAAIVLVSTGRRYIGAALVQGVLPAAGIVFILLA